MGVHVASIVELLNTPAVAIRTAATTNSSDPSPQTFLESLLATSDASSDILVGVEAGHQQNSLPGDAKEQGTASQLSSILPQIPLKQTAFNPVLEAQQTPLTNGAPTQMQLPAGKFVLSSHSPRAAVAQPKVKVSGSESNIAQPPTQKPERVPSSQPLDALQASLTSSSSETQSVTAPQVATSQPTHNVPYAIASANLDPLSSIIPGWASNAIPNAAVTPNASVAARAFSNSVASVTPGDVQKEVRNAAQTLDPSATASEVPGTSQNVAQSAALSSLPTAGQSAASSSLPTAGQSAASSSLPTAGQNWAPNPLTSANESAASTSLPAPAQTVGPSFLPSVVKTVTPSFSPKTTLAAVTDTNQKAGPAAPAGTAHNSSSGNAAPAVVSAPQHPEPVQVPQVTNNTSSKEDGPSALNVNAAGKAHLPAAASDPSGFAPALGVPSTTAQQMVVMVQPASAVLTTAETSLDSTTVTKPAAVASAKSKDGATNTNTDVSDPKPHAPAAPAQAGSQGTSQEPASSDDQTQGGASQQAQNAAPAQMSFAIHTITSIDHSLNSGTAAQSQPAATLAEISHPAKTSDSAAPAPAALPQSLPTINTAKLIQSMGQSEMRVGMRSNEFGNISINTSATRDLISAQISLDHGELAKTLATHLPEMQARLGGSQAVDVRIDMNGQSTGQGAGTSSGMSQNAADQSRSDRQQRGSAGSGNSTDGFAGQGRASAAASPAAESRLETRLDIRA